MEDYEAAASSLDIIFFGLMVVSVVLLALVTFFNAALNPLSYSSLANLLEDLSISLAFLISMYGVSLFNWNRKSISNVLRMVNEKNWTILKRGASKKFRKQRNLLHLFCIVLHTTMLLLGNIVACSFYMRFYVNGHSPFYIFNPENRHFSVSQFIYHMILFHWLGFFLPSYLAFIIEALLRVCLYYKVLADSFRSIGNWDQIVCRSENYLRFKSIMREMNDLQFIMDEMNAILSSYIGAYIGLTINTTGLFVFNMTKAMSLMDIIAFMPFATWQISYVAIFCTLSQVVAEAVSFSYWLMQRTIHFIFAEGFKGSRGCLWL